MNPKTMDRLLRLISRYNENRCDEDEFLELTHWIETNEDARKRYCEMQQQECLLQHSTTANANTSSGTVHVSRFPQKTKRWPTWIVGLAASLVLFAILGGGYWVIPNVHKTSHHAAVAVIRSTSDSTPRKLYATSYKLPEGHHTIDFFSGAQIQMQGKAAFKIKDAMNIEINHASLVANVTPTAKGFRISSKESSIVDLGTEFALNINKNESSLKVFKGEVLASTTTPSGSTERTILVRPEQPLRYNPAQKRYNTISSKAPDFATFQFVSTPPLASLENYQQRILSSNPSAYWNFASESFKGNAFHDPISNRTIRLVGENISNTSTNGNQAITFKPNEQFHMAELLGEMEFNKQQPFSIEFLFCADRISRATLLALFKKGSVNALGSAHHFILVETMARQESYTSTPGAIRAAYRPVPSASGLDGINSFSNTQYIPGKWTHFAMTFDGETLRTWLDADLQHAIDLGEDENFNSGRYAMILGQASPSEPTHIPTGIYRPFVGSIDELAFYHRALSESDIQNHAKSIGH